MPQQCDKCGQTNVSVKDYQRGTPGTYDDESDQFTEEPNPQLYAPETMDDGSYCSRCVKKAHDDWWKKEQKSYIYDNEGNTPDDKDFQDW